MADKKKELTQEQKIILQRRGLIPERYTVLLDYPETMMVRNVITNETRVIYKRDPWGRISH